MGTLASDGPVHLGDAAGVEHRLIHVHEFGCDAALEFGEYAANKLPCIVVVGERHPVEQVVAVAGQAHDGLRPPVGTQQGSCRGHALRRLGQFVVIRRDAARPLRIEVDQDAFPMVDIAIGGGHLGVVGCPVGVGTRHQLGLQRVEREVGPLRSVLPVEPHDLVDQWCHGVEASCGGERLASSLRLAPQRAQLTHATLSIEQVKRPSDLVAVGVRRVRKSGVRIVGGHCTTPLQRLGSEASAAAPFQVVVGRVADAATASAAVLVNVRAASHASRSARR